MAGAQGSAGGGLDMEKELTCSICTDILYQPLTLLDCLHTFCGSCSKEWFAWQAVAAANNRRTTHPYTCPSCRESVRGTKADWRLTALLENFLRANPDKAKTVEDKEEMQRQYKPGEDVIPKVEIQREESDSEDERLMAEIRELSMASVDPDTARRRTDRAAARSNRHRRRVVGTSETGPQPRLEEPERAQQPRRRASQQMELSEARLREHNANDPHVEHQPSLRSLLSASQIESHDVQQEILQSIYADGLLESIDIDNLTVAQEEELTERIAEAYRRRQRRRDRAGNQERRRPENRSPTRATVGAEVRERHHVRTSSMSAEQPRSRPPVSRPHVFEQAIQDSGPRHRRSTSSIGQSGIRSSLRPERPSPSASASRSATELPERSLTADTARERQRKMSSNSRSTSNSSCTQLRTPVPRARTTSSNDRDLRSNVVPHPLEAVRRQAGATNNSSPSLPMRASGAAITNEHIIRPATSSAAFAPEVVANVRPVPKLPVTAQVAPQISCTRCEKPDIQHTLHYNCPWCRNGSFNLCLSCYREGRGCDHWFGFGYAAYERWRRLAPPEGWPMGSERPHTLVPRRYVDHMNSKPTPLVSERLQEGAFCESCFNFANECYWYCFHCLEGAWGFCNTCVQQGRHCTHPLLPLSHLSSLHQPHQDPAKAVLVQMPHLRQDSYAVLPVLTDCDICRQPIQPQSTRFHCFQCSEGDYDICAVCYYGLVATNKISEANGPKKWRKCLEGHRMLVVGYQDVPEGGQQRLVVREQVGGRRYKVDNNAGYNPGHSAPPPPTDSSLGVRCLALWSYFPRDGSTDELAFPKNAEVTEVEDLNSDWSVGTYAGKVGLFPSNHIRRT